MIVQQKNDQMYDDRNDVNEDGKLYETFIKPLCHFFHIRMA